MLRERLEQVHRRIGAAAERAGRSPGSVTLVGVTKGIPAAVIQEAVALGVTDLGENRVQEARQKQLALGSRLQAQGSGLQPSALSLQPIRWHLVGHLQRNKAKDAAALFEVIHSIDSQALAEELERHLASKTLEVFVQVNVSGEATKFGCAPADAPALAKTVAALPHLRLRGLMTIPPLTDEAEGARPFFRQLRMLRDELQVRLGAPLILSMGMSHDFEIAIEEGADLVRIGRAIFQVDA